MTATESRETGVPVSAAGNPIGFGRMLRKEDARFLRGRGHYLDDVQDRKSTRLNSSHP